jgi:hypothetical protein
MSGLRMMGWLALVWSAVGQAAGLSTLSDAGGGAVAAPVVQDGYLYVGAGATVNTWDMSDPAHPAYVGRTGAAPAPGTISAVTPVGTYLYVAWSNPDGSAGISIFSRSDPAHPAKVAEYDDYVDSAFRGPLGLAASGNHVYLVDAQNGLFVLDATDPLAPLVVGHSSAVFVADSVALFGNVLFATGSDFIGGRDVVAVDVTDPANPVALGSASLDGFAVLRVVPTDGYAFGVGNDLMVYDTTDPSNMTQIADVSIDVATGATRLGNTLYLIGDSGVQVWDITTPSAPQYARTVTMPTFAPDQVTATPYGPLVLTHTDRAVLVGTADPQHPTLTAQFTLPLGVSAHAAAFDATHVYFGEEGYGIGVADSSTLAPLGRFDADLPASLAARDIEDIDIDGHYAYLAVWGFGVIVADIATPTAPVARGSFEFPFASAIEEHGNRVYVSSTTNGGIFKVLDVSDPSAPTELGELATSQTYDLTVRGNYAYLADGADFGDGGLRVVDVSDPATPTVTGQDLGCPYADGLFVSPDGNTTYIACSSDENFHNALRIVDTSDKSLPTLVGTIALPGDAALPDYNAAHAVVVIGTTAYVGNEYGVDQVDVIQPSQPMWRHRDATGSAVRRLALAPDGRLYAFAGTSGVYVYTPVPDRLFGDGFDQ